MDEVCYRFGSNGVIISYENGNEVELDGAHASVAAWRVLLEAEELITPGTITDYPS